MDKSVVLNNGVTMPLIGLGTFQIKDPIVVKEVIEYAIETGYRLIDTAAVYKNEIFIGNCIKEMITSGRIQRSDIFITTKLGPKDMDGSKVEEAVNKSLSNLQTDYIDLYLIHWPAKQGLKHSDPKHPQIRKDVWMQLEKIHKETNKLRSIGVSNFTVKHVTDLQSYCSIKPAVIQNEFHPDYQEENIRKLCKTENIQFQSYSTLGQSRLVKDVRFKEVADRHNKTTAQILLRWAIQKNISVIPKSTNKIHIKENFNIFDFILDGNDMQYIDNCSNKVKFAWDPIVIQ